jgi:hypothetical protein
VNSSLKTSILQFDRLVKTVLFFNDRDHPEGGVPYFFLRSFFWRTHLSNEESPGVTPSA